MKHSRPCPGVETDERERMPNDIKRRVRSDVLSKLHQTFVVDEEVEGREEDRSWFLQGKNSNERPLAVELRNAPFTSDERLCRFVHASVGKLRQCSVQYLMLNFLLIFAFVSAVPLNHVLKYADIEVFISRQLEKMIR